MADLLVIDGSFGEGGGQILRSALGLSAVTGRAVSVANIRASRRHPGLAAQHLAAVRALARICDARVTGDSLDSREILFEPRCDLRAGRYRFDVGALREGGSAGSVTLVLQAVIPALALAKGQSDVTVLGGTHVIHSPCFDYMRDIWLHALGSMGLSATAHLMRWGWYPAGQGEVRVRLSGLVGGTFRPLARTRRRGLDRLWGRSVVTRIPVTVAQRMADHATALLADVGISAEIALEPVGAVSAGAGIFIAAQYGTDRAGFEGIGARGKPAEQVAEEAVQSFLAFHRSGAAVDAHLGDQLIVPAALAASPSRYSVERVSDHLRTSAWLVERFGLARVDIVEQAKGTGRITVTPCR